MQFQSTANCYSVAEFTLVEETVVSCQLIPFENCYTNLKLVTNKIYKFESNYM